MSDDGLGKVGEAAKLASDLMRVAGENPEARAAGAELAKTALTIAETVNTVLLPLVVLNNWAAKGRRYFDRDFGPEMEAKLADVPVERITEPRESVAIAVLQGLGQAHAEPDLRELFLNLMRAEMDLASRAGVHRAFAGIVNELSSDDARMLPRVMNRPNGVPIARMIARVEGGEIITHRHVVDLGADWRPDAAVLVDNWIRLGLVSVDYLIRLVGEGEYDWVGECPEAKAAIGRSNTSPPRIAPTNGVLTWTAFGAGFARAVGILQ